MLTGIEEEVTACIPADLSLTLLFMLGDGRLAFTTHQTDTTHAQGNREMFFFLTLCVIQFWSDNRKGGWIFTLSSKSIP